MQDTLHPAKPQPLQPPPWAICLCSQVGSNLHRCTVGPGHQGQLALGKMEHPCTCVCAHVCACTRPHMLNLGQPEPIWKQQGILPGVQPAWRKGQKQVRGKRTLSRQLPTQAGSRLPHK